MKAKDVMTRHVITVASREVAPSLKTDEAIRDAVLAELTASPGRRDT
jgi:hypothetical protein